MEYQSDEEITVAADLEKETRFSYDVKKEQDYQQDFSIKKGYNEEEWDSSMEGEEDHQDQRKMHQNLQQEQQNKQQEQEQQQQQQQHQHQQKIHKKQDKQGINKNNKKESDNKSNHQHYNLEVDYSKFNVPLVEVLYPIKLNLCSGNWNLRDQFMWPIIFPESVIGHDIEEYIQFCKSDTRIELFANRLGEDLDFPLAFNQVISKSIRAQLLEGIPIIWNERKRMIKFYQKKQDTLIENQVKSIWDEILKRYRPQPSSEEPQSVFSPSFIQYIKEDLAQELAESSDESETENNKNSGSLPFFSDPNFYNLTELDDEDSRDDEEIGVIVSRNTNTIVDDTGAAKDDENNKYDNEFNDFNDNSVQRKDKAEKNKNFDGVAPQLDSIDENNCPVAPPAFMGQSIQKPTSTAKTTKISQHLLNQIANYHEESDPESGTESHVYKHRKKNSTRIQNKKRKLGTAFEAHYLNDERIEIRLDICIAGVKYQDAFDWNPSTPLFWCEIFAHRLATEFGLSREFQCAISMEIRRQLIMYWRYSSEDHNDKKFVYNTDRNVFVKNILNTIFKRDDIIEELELNLNSKQEVINSIFENSSAALLDLVNKALEARWAREECLLSEEFDDDLEDDEDYYWLSYGRYIYNQNDFNNQQNENKNNDLIEYFMSLPPYFPTSSQSILTQRTVYRPLAALDSHVPHFTTHIPSYIFWAYQEHANELREKYYKNVCDKIEKKISRKN